MELPKPPRNFFLINFFSGRSVKAMKFSHALGLAILNHAALFRIGLLFVALLFNGCTYSPNGTYFKHGVTQYHGDGTIRDVSQRALVFGSRGYVIEFDKFNLDNAYDKELRIVNLPTITNSRVEICLAVEDEEFARMSIDSVDRLRKKLEAEITTSLVSSNGVTVVNFTSKIGNLVWSSPVHGYSGYWLYAEKGSFFTPRPGETYSLRIHYLPDALLRGKRGCIYLYSGCGGS